MHGVRTTMGEPNRKTGARNIAGHMSVFSSVSERDAWAESPFGYKRLAVTKTTLRLLCRGMTLKNFERMLDIYGGHLR